MYEILAGVDYVHKAGLLHRDLKPGNILINLGDWSARIWDFGLARSLRDCKDCELIVRENIEKNGKEEEAEEEKNGVERPKTAIKCSSKDELDGTLHKAPGINTSLLVRKKTAVIRKGSGDEYRMKEICKEMNKKKRISRALKDTLKEREEGERELTPHVVTRFYRSPEVILMDKNYNKKVDIWAWGAIFWELLKMKKENCASYLSRKSMFMGKSWAPLSPNRRKKSTKILVIDRINKEENKSMKLYGVTEKDQMNWILKVIGVPNEEDLSYMNKAKQKAFLNTYEHYKRKNLNTLFPAEEDEWIHLLSKMLEFNPFFRFSAEECMNHPYFSDLDKSTKTDEEVREKLRDEKEKEKGIEWVFDKSERLTHVIHQFKLKQKLNSHY